MKKKIIAVQYLEDRPELAQMTAGEIRARLRAAFDCLPISILILGWHVPEALFAACAEETARAGAKLYRWHPLLTGSADFTPREEWQTVGLNGAQIPGFRGLPEFTFLCPNRPQAAEAVLEQFQHAIRDHKYDGVFLDRIRFPSPAADPAHFLACFCPDCQRAAGQRGLDLISVQQQILSLLGMPGGVAVVAQTLLDPAANENGHPDLVALKKFLAFRTESITRFLRTAAEIARGEGLEVGLDCFSPALTSLVGQDLAVFDPLCNWIKVMTYGHALGPAALPYEFEELARWLMRSNGMTEDAALNLLSASVRLSLPSTLAELRESGLSSTALASETLRARAAVRTLLSGIELVEVAGVTRLNPRQIRADLRAFLDAGSDGLALSWDLEWIPQQRLELVRALLE